MIASVLQDCYGAVKTRRTYPPSHAPSSLLTPSREGQGINGIDRARADASASAHKTALRESEPCKAEPRKAEPRIRSVPKPAANQPVP